MPANHLDTEKRIEELAAAAAKLTDLPVADQFRILADEHGLRLTDTGWEVVYDPDEEGLQEHVTVIPVVRPQGD